MSSPEGVSWKREPITFFSKKLTDTQMRRYTIEEEAMVIETLKNFEPWIFGVVIQVISDHNPLTYLTRSFRCKGKI